MYVYYYNAIMKNYSKEKKLQVYDTCLQRIVKIFKNQCNQPIIPYTGQRSTNSVKKGHGNHGYEIPVSYPK